MSAPTIEVGSYMETAIKSAREGGQAIMDLYDSDLKYTSKSDSSPVTNADLASNSVIKKVLARTNIPVLSEEDADSDTRLGSDIIWVVDPLDGTLDFLEHTGEFTVMVALVQNTRPTLGVIYWPDNDILYAAWTGGGAWRHDRSGWGKIGVKKTASLPYCTLVTSRHHITESEEKFINSLGFGDRRTLGSSLKVVDICSAQADAYFTFTDKMKEWDTAASCCILHEAGGKMTDMNGNPLFYNDADVFHRNGILATNGVVHDHILRRYRELQQAS